MPYCCQRVMIYRDVTPSSEHPSRFRKRLISRTVRADAKKAVTSFLVYDNIVYLKLNRLGSKLYLT